MLRAADLTAKLCLMMVISTMSLKGEATTTRKELLGRAIFNDTNLSSPPGQACASCHNPENSFIDPNSNEPTSEGVIPDRYGPRNTPTVLYAASSPPFHFDSERGLYVGGQFNDGRASDLQSQAKGPFLGPLEMNNKTPEEVVAKVRQAPYASLFRRVYGPNALDNPTVAYERMVDAISAFEKTSELNPFRSKYDRYLEGQDTFSEQERRGRDIFEREDKGNCAACHPSRPSNNGKQRPLFTDHTYDNIGVPKNPVNKFYSQPGEFNPKGAGFVDAGLGGNLKLTSEMGKFKVPTLRNIAKTAPYTHNGYFKTLRGLIHFYNTKEIKPTCDDPLTPEARALALGCWPAPEETLNENHTELGKLGLSSDEEADLEAFLNTLTDD